MNVVVEILSFHLYWLISVVFEVYYFIFRNRPRKSIKNENIVITGSASGMGKLLAERLAVDGNTLHLVDINEEANNLLTQELKNTNCDVFTYTCDIANIEKVQKLKDEVEKNSAGSHISYLFNNAAIVVGKTFLQESSYEFSRGLNINVMGAVNMTKAFLPDMVTNYGHIINMGSVAGMVAGPQLSSYCTSKFAMTGFSRSLISEFIYLGIKNVKVTSVHPHFTNTGMFNGASVKFDALFPMLEPDYVVDKVIIATKEEKQMLILPKTIYMVLLLEQFMPVRVFESYLVLMGNDLMKTFKNIRHNN